MERHIDHITRQLEDTNKHLNIIASERDQIYEELTTFKNLQMNQEHSKTDLQRAISRNENEKHSLRQ